MDLNMKGRTALVCASTAGLGEAVARSLAAEGANVVITGRRGEVAASIAAELPSAIGVGVDLLTDDGPAQAVRAALDAFGKVDILVLNGPGPKAASALDVTTADIDSAIATLVRPQHKLVSMLIDGMRERGWGRILYVGATTVIEPLPALALANIGRDALAGYLKTLATQVAPDGVTVNLLLPGLFRTERRDQMEIAKAQRSGKTPEEIREEEAADIPMRRYGDAREFGALGALLCSDLASYVTGTAIRADGGFVHSL